MGYSMYLCPKLTTCQLFQPSTTVAEQIWFYKNGILSPAFKLSDTIYSLYYYMLESTYLKYCNLIG